MAAAKKSRSLASEVERFRLGLQALKNNSADFKHLAKELASFDKTIAALIAADAAQEKAKAAMMTATQQVTAQYGAAKTLYASLKRSWQAKYGVSGPKSREFEAATQGKVVKRTSKKAKSGGGTPS